MKHIIVHAFVQSLAHKERVEVQATTNLAGKTTEIRYLSALKWPWPRQFAYTREFFSHGSASECLNAVHGRVENAQEHVVNFFSDQLDSEISHFEAAGYVEAWRSRLLGRDLSHRWQKSGATAAEVHEVASSADRVRYASLPGISNPGVARDDASVHNFFATRSGEMLAKGQLVYHCDSVAYVSDMFTKPEHRNKGLCTSILAAIENKARSLGATHSCLAPGPEVESFGLYEKYGYAEAGIRSVLIRMGEQAARCSARAPLN